MGNTRYAKDVVTISALRMQDGEVLKYKHKVRHLHNFILDSWYETGLFGSVALLVLLFYFLFKGVKTFVTNTGRQEMIIIFLTSFMAILVSGFSSFSYTSNQFTLFLFLISGGLYYLSTSLAEPCCTNRNYV